MCQRRIEEYDMAPEYNRNRNRFSGSNSKEDMQVSTSEIERHFDRYHDDNLTDESSDKDHSSNSRNSRYRLGTRAKSRRSPRIRGYDNGSDSDPVNFLPPLYLEKIKEEENEDIQNLVGRMRARQLVLEGRSRVVETKIVGERKKYKGLSYRSSQKCFKRN